MKKKILPNSGRDVILCKFVSLEAQRHLNEKQNCQKNPNLREK